MSRKKRLLRIGCISLLLLAFVGYFAFSTFFFSPFEGRFKADVAGLIPRDVDVYLARADLKAAFTKFPDLEAAERLSGNPAYDAFVGSPEWASMGGEDIESTLDDVRRELSKIPLGLDVLDLIAGEDIALAAEFKGKGVENTDWAIYARASFTGKLAVSALRHPGLLRLGQQGIEVSQSEGVVSLSGGQLKGSIHVARVLDVVVAGNSERLVRRALELELARSEDSLLLAAPYNDSILSVDRNAQQRDIEVVYDVRKMRETWGLNKPWPDPKSERFAPAFLARLLPVAAVRRVLGIVDFDEGVDVDLSGEFSSELMTAGQERVYRSKGFDQDEAMDVARFVPDDSTLFVYLRGPIATILQMVVDSMEPAARDNFTETLRTLNLNSIQELIDLFDDALVDRIAFVLHPGEWESEKDYVVDAATGERTFVGPPNDGARVFAWAVIAYVSDERALTELREKIAAAGPRIGIQGREPGSNGYFSNPIGGGLYVREFWSSFIPGTGHIASLFYGDNLLLSNRAPLINTLVQNRVARSSNTPRLSSRRDFQLMLQDSLKGGNLLTWLDPASGAEVVRAQAEAGARGRLRSSIDFVSKRREVERTVLRESFEGRSRSRLTADEATSLDDIVDSRLRSFQDRVVEENLPRELASIARTVEYLKGVQAAMALLRLSPKEFDISLRVEVPYGKKQ